MVIVPVFYLCNSLTCPSVATEPTYQMILYVAIGNLIQQHIHFVIKPRVVSWRTHNKALITEHIADNIRVMGFRHIVHNDVFDTRLTCCASNFFSHSLGITIHRAVANYDTFFCFVFAHAVV